MTEVVTGDNIETGNENWELICENTDNERRYLFMSGKLTVAEAAAITGKSERTLYRYINQGKIKGNKIIDKGKEIFNIHIDELKKISGETESSTISAAGEENNSSETSSDKSTENNRAGESYKINRKKVPVDETAEILKNGNMVILPVDLYNKEKEEREKYFQGMMMYRFKYEELETKLKLLPAPAEVITHEFEKIRLELDEKDKALQEKDKELTEQLSVNETKEQALKETDSRLRSVNSRLKQSESEIDSLENTLKAERERLEEEKKKTEEKLAKENADLKELLRKKEVERRETEDLLKMEKSRSWWKKLFGMK